MREDARGIAVTTESETAARHLDAAVLSLAAQRADAPALLSRALMADPGLVAGHCLAGFMQLLAARRPLAREAGRSLAQARLSAEERGATWREVALVEALAAWQEEGDMRHAADRLERALRAEPLDLLSFRLAHAIRFMLGDAPGMRLAAEAALPAWTEGVPGRGFVLGCHAFALEETGDPGRAERVGREAVALEPGDAWGAHAVAHAMEETRRPRDGLLWLARVEPGLSGLGNFTRHLSWHRALFHLRLGEGDAALELYDRRVRDEPTEDVRDVMNAASLLWRLEARDIPAGRWRWEELAELAERRIGDHAWAFADLHYVLSLAAAGRRDAVEAMLASIAGRAVREAGTQAVLHAQVGFAAARGVAAALGGEPEEAVRLLEPLRGRLHRLGGSRAQRDLLEQILRRAARAAAGDGRRPGRRPGRVELRCRAGAAMARSE